jgi:hypothetical protein
MKEGTFFAPSNSALLPALVPAAATAITAVSTASAVFLCPGFIHIERPAIQFVAVERGNGLYTLAVIAHFDECEASGLPGIAVGYDVHTVNCAVRLKKGSKPIFGSTEAEISYKYIFQLVFFLKFAEQRIGEPARTVVTGLCEEPN